MSVETTENAAYGSAETSLEATEGDLEGESVPLLSEEFTPSQAAALRAEFPTVGSLQTSEGKEMFAPTIRSVAARLTESPPNFHQATIFFATSRAPEDVEMAARAWLLLIASAVMVLTQTLTSFGACFGAVLVSCSDSNQCREGHAGTYCSVGGRDNCDFCGRWVPLEIEFPSTGGTMNWAEDAEFIGFNLSLVAEVCSNPAARRGTRGNGDNKIIYPATVVASWCETCVHAIDGSVDSSTQTARIVANIKAMKFVDWVALTFSTFIVACKVVGELKDIQLCVIQVRHVGAKLTRGWRLALSVIGEFRRRVFLPMLVTTVPVLVMLKGGDVSTAPFSALLRQISPVCSNVHFDVSLCICAFLKRGDTSSESAQLKCCVRVDFRHCRFASIRWQYCLCVTSTTSHILCSCQRRCAHGLKTWGVSS